MIAEKAPLDGGFEDVRLMTARDLAACLKISTRQVHRMNRSAILPAPLRIGGCTRWPATEIAAWLRAGSPAREQWELQRGAELAPAVEAS